MAKQRENGISFREANDILSYDPDTGVFRWKVALAHKIKVGQVAGFVRGNGYLHINVRNVRYAGSHLAWLFMTGEWPRHEIDHRDLNRSNNRWFNLRAVTHQQNCRNRIGWFKRGKSLKGAYTCKNISVPWRSMITVNKKCVWLGNFRTEQEAHEAYVAAATKYFGEFANDGKNDAAKHR